MLQVRRIALGSTCTCGERWSKQLYRSSDRFSWFFGSRGEILFDSGFVDFLNLVIELLMGC